MNSNKVIVAVATFLGLLTAAVIIGTLAGVVTDPASIPTQSARVSAPATPKPLTPIYNVRLDGEPFPWESCGEPSVQAQEIPGYYHITFKSVMGETVSLSARKIRMWEDKNKTNYWVYQNECHTR